LHSIWTSVTFLIIRQKIEFLRSMKSYRHN